VRGLFARAVDALRAELNARGKGTHFRVFERYELDAGVASRPTYAELARELGVATTDVTNYLHVARKEFRRIVLATLREWTASDDEFREEARALLGVKV
jgi:hypothetical protein